MKHAVRLTLDADHETLERERETILHLVADITATGEGIEVERPPLTVVFVLDVSHSMSGEPLHQVIRSTQRLIGMLRPIDQAGVVAFSSNASIVAPVEKLETSAQARLCRAVGRMQSESWTNMQAGLELAKQILPERAPHERQVILLMSDGMPNRGISTAEGLASLASSMRPQVSISTLGFGRDHAEPLLSSVADAGVGTYHYIRDPKLSHLQFAAALGAQGDVVADSLELCVVPGDNVQVLALVGQPRTRFGRGGVLVDIPDLVHGATHQVAARLAVKTGRECGKQQVAHVSLAYHPAGAKEELRIEEHLSLPVTQRSSMLKQPALHKVLVLRAAEERSKARESADRGRFHEASEALRSAADMLAQAPGFNGEDGSALAEAWDQLNDDADLYDQQPDELAYREFRRGQRLNTGGNVSAGAVLPHSQSSRAMLDDAAGPLPAATIHRVETGERFVLDKPMNIIGRSRTCDVYIPSAKVSRQSAAIVAQDGKFWVEDLGSANGVWMNGAKIIREALHHGDQLIIGDDTLRYEDRME